MQSIDPLFFAQNSLIPKESASQELGKDDFLNLLMVQLRNQDPLNVQDDSEFIAQMAQFSSLEQMTNLNSSMAGLLQFQQLSQGSELLGKTVSALIPNANDPEGEGTAVSGTVTEARLVDGRIKLIIDGKAIDPEHILNVSMAQ